MRTLLFAALFAAAASTTNATLLDVRAEQTEPSGTPDGLVVNQILIDFEGQLFGQQMIVSLSAGSIYNNAFGGDTAPSDALIGPFPEVAADTFVAICGDTVANSLATLVVGGSTEFPESSGTRLFDDTGIDIAWAPSPGVVVADQTDCLTAQITLSDDAFGTVHYYGNGATWPQVGSIENGVLTFVPEPSAALLAGAALLGVSARRR